MLVMISIFASVSQAFSVTLTANTTIYNDTTISNYGGQNIIDGTADHGRAGEDAYSVNSQWVYLGRFDIMVAIPELSGVTITYAELNLTNQPACDPNICTTSGTLNLDRMAQHGWIEGTYNDIGQKACASYGNAASYTQYNCADNWGAAGANGTADIAARVAGTASWSGALPKFYNFNNIAAVIQRVADGTDALFDFRISAMDLADNQGGHFGTLESASGKPVLYIEYTINAAPTTPSVTLTPNPAYTTTDLVCTATINDTDETGTFTTDIIWFKNNITQIEATAQPATLNVDYTYTLNSANLTIGDFWGCEVRVSDGAKYSAWANSTEVEILTIINIDWDTEQPTNNTIHNTNPLQFTFNATNTTADTLDTCSLWLNGTASPIEFNQYSRWC